MVFRKDKDGAFIFLKHLYENIFIANENDKKHPNIIKRLVYDIWGLKGKFMRERNQFSDYEMISKHSSIKFINIYQPTKYASKVPGMKIYHLRIYKKSLIQYVWNNRLSG